jgi:hypothetical protein
MNTEYLYNIDKSSLESYVADLNTKKSANPSNYSEHYLETSDSGNLEIVDARARLATIETKEALDELEAAISELENNNTGTNTSVPTKKLVPVGKQFVDFSRKSDNGCCAWIRSPVGNGKLYAVTSDLYKLQVSYDSGKTFNTIDTNSISIDTNGDESFFENSENLSRFGKKGEVIFYKNAFILFTQNWSAGTGTYIFRSVDLINFKLIGNITESDSFTSSFAFIGNNKLIFMDVSNHKAYDVQDDSVVCLGNTNADVEVDDSVVEDRVIKLNDTLFFKSFDRKIKILSDNYLDTTIVENELIPKDVLNFSIQNNKLIASNQDTAVYSDDGTNWQKIRLPDIGEVEYYETNCDNGIQVLYNESENRYYSFIKYLKNFKDFCGIYCWTDLNEPPVRVDSSIPIDDFYSPSVPSCLKKLGNKMYFLIRGTLYQVSNMNITKVLDGFDRDSIFTCTGRPNNSGYGENLTMSLINNNIIINSPGTNTILQKEVDIYRLDDYTATGEETDVITATF